MAEKRVRVISILTCSLIFWFLFLSFAAPRLDKSPADLLSKNVQAYFSDYYRGVNQGKYPPAPQILKEVKGIFTESGLAKPKEEERIAAQGDFFNLTLLLNRLLRKYDLYTNIFVNPQTNTVDCWLSKSGKKEERTLTIRGRKMSFSVMSFDNLLLHGYSYYYFPKRDDIQLLSFNDTIFCNLEELKKKAEERWRLLLGRYRKKPSYNPYPSERLRRGLLASAWEGLFLGTVRKNNIDEAEGIFIGEAARKLKEIGIYHEAGHRLADEQSPQGDDLKSEAAALLTEMRFGPLPEESLNTLLSFAWRSRWPVYRSAGQGIIRDFLRLIEKGAVSGELRKRLLAIKGDSLLKRQKVFRYLTYDEIIKLAGEEFKRVISN